MTTFFKRGTIHGCFIAGAGLLLIPSISMAKATGPCVDCHTMHNSQDGTHMQFDPAIPDAQDVLLRGGCVACHTGTNDGTNNIPYVFSTDVAGAVYGDDGTLGNTLAGGSFYWVAQAGGDATGHNVSTDAAYTLITADATLATAPGGTFAGQVSCAGTMGCHGDRTVGNDFGAINGSHHGDDSLMDGSTVANSYRFLLGVLGLEDSDWEYQPTSAAHNQYYGIDRTADTEDGNAGALGGTISSLCAQCHDDFHNGLGNVQGATGWGNPWVRHPTDFDMAGATGTEYVDYGGTGVNTYQVTAPVASNVLANGVVQNVYTNTDDAIVTCISCHRAHGTPNPDLLRWDYTTIISAGGASSDGCFACHTTKDDV